MSRGLLARLRSWRSAPNESSSAPEDPVAAGSSGDERSEGTPDASGTAEIPTASTNGAVEEVAPAPEPPAEIPPIAAAEERPVPAPARPLPPFRPSTETEALLAETVAPPLTLTLSEAIQLVHDSGGDAMELRFLRRELQRRGREGSESPDLWPRVEQAVTGRLRRVGRLAEGQPLTLLRDPKVASTAGSSPGS
jgi:hypothetical protein